MNKKNQAVLTVKLSYDPNNLKDCSAAAEAEAEGTTSDLLNCLSVAVTGLHQAGVPAGDLFKAFLHGLDEAHKED